MRGLRATSRRLPLLRVSCALSQLKPLAADWNNLSRSLKTQCRALEHREKRFAAGMTSACRVACGPAVNDVAPVAEG